MKLAEFYILYSIEIFNVIFLLEEKEHISDTSENNNII